MQDWCAFSSDALRCLGLEPFMRARGLLRGLLQIRAPVTDLREHRSALLPNMESEDRLQL